MIKVACPKCQFCGEQEVVEVDEGGYNAWKNGELAQNAFPDMPVDEREMLISGTHPKCWDEFIANDPREGADA